MSIEASEILNEFYVLKHGEMFGPFTEGQLREGLQEGEFTLEDFAQAEGQSDWLPLGSVLGIETEAQVERGAMAPDWRTILKWAGLRLRCSLDEQSHAAGMFCLAAGTVSIVLSHWPFVFWLPWFATAVVAAIALLKRKQEVPGALILVGVVCIPLLFLIFESRRTAGSDAAREYAPTPVAAPKKEAAKPIPAILPAKTTAEAPPPPASKAPVPPLETILPTPVTPHYAAVEPDSASVPLPTAPASATKPSATIPPSSEPAPDAPAPEEVDFVHEHPNSLILVKGAEGSGSGFICKDQKTTLLFTNVHVIADIKQPAMTGLDGELVFPGSADVAAGRDIARFELPKAPPNPFEAISNFDANVRIDDDVVVLGNSGGGGVVTKLKGKIVGIGPDRIEVSAEFIPGNSGSPIIHIKTGKVIGIATYLTRRYDEFSSAAPGANSSPPPEGAKGAIVVRRFGYRIDNVPRWETVHWTEFRQNAETIEHISALTEDIFDFLGALRSGSSPHFATETLRRPASEWMTTIRTRHMSVVDRSNATRGFLNSLRFMVRADVTAADARLRYTYFRDELRHERDIRERLYKAFDEQSSKLSSP